MADYRNSEGTTTVIERRSNGGVIIGGILLVIALMVGFLFATEFGAPMFRAVPCQRSLLAQRAVNCPRWI